MNKNTSAPAPVQEQERAETFQAVDIKRPHWRCICGTVAMPLTDDTTCKCEDYYDQDWKYVDPAQEVQP